MIASLSEAITLWFPITYALDSMNRSMGLKDLYPFIQKPAFVQDLAHRKRGAVQQAAQPAARA